tara:strand:- start:5231 stop:5506 length:276 start_codon:yes stop_codon:yes gene_type:complete
MSDQKPRNYVGNGTQSGEYYINLSLKKSQLEPHFYEYNGEQYVRLTVGKLREANEWGKTHSVWINDYDPNKSQQQESKQNAPVSAGDGLPF